MLFIHRENVHINLICDLPISPPLKNQDCYLVFLPSIKLKNTLLKSIIEHVKFSFYRLTIYKNNSKFKWFHYEQFKLKLTKSWR